LAIGVFFVLTAFGQARLERSSVIGGQPPGFASEVPAPNRFNAPPLLRLQSTLR